jgi:hypothetical protein
MNMWKRIGKVELTELQSQGVEVYSKGIEEMMQEPCSKLSSFFNYLVQRRAVLCRDF